MNVLLKSPVDCHAILFALAVAWVAALASASPSHAQALRPTALRMTTTRFLPEC
jgi:hypothetical protein